MTLAEGTPKAAPAAQATPPFEIDILDPRFYDDPWEAYRWLRTNAPLYWDAAQRAVGRLPPRGRQPHQPPPGAVLGRRRACAPRSRRRCRSSRWTTPSTPASAG